MSINNKEFNSSSKYDIYSKLLFIARKYFDVPNEDFLKTGLFGYITESMAMITKDSSVHKTMLYNESFLNTAVMPKSVYNWAKMFGVSITAATPAYADIQVTIPVESLIFTKGSTLPNVLKYGMGNNNEILNTSLRDKFIMVLDRDNPFIAGEFKFMMEKSIFIYKDSPTSEEITVKYCRTEEPNTLFQDIENYFIKTYITSDNYLSFVVRAYQYEIKDLEKQISSSSFLDTKIHKFYFTDQFVGAKLKYVIDGKSTPVELKFSNVAREENQSPNFAFYNLVDVNTLQITFSSTSGDLMPTANSTLQMKVFTTKGAQGNITFTGDVIFRLQEESLKNIPILSNFFSESAIGGKDSPSINKIKSTIINEISTRDVIVTETDLNNYFLILTSLLETINDGKITFIKKRDDILRRVFSAYILMRDGLDINGNVAESGYVSKVIPTNTLNADFAISSNISKPFGTIIKRKSGSSNEFEYVPSNALDGSEDYYVIPFFMRVNLDPFRKVKYIYNLTDDSTTLSYSNNSLAVQSSSNVYVLPSTISIKRTLEGSNTTPYYLVTATFITNNNFQRNITPQNGQFRLTFYRKGSTTPQAGDVFTYVRGNGLSITSVASEDDPNRYTTTLEFILNVDVDGSEFDFSSEKANNNYGTFINLYHNNSEVSLPEDVKIEIDFVNILGSANLKFISDKFLLLFRNLDELMFSDINLNKINPRWNLMPNKLTVDINAPSSPSVGDIWIDSDDSYKLYICVTAGSFPVSPVATLETTYSVDEPTIVGEEGEYYLFSLNGVNKLYKYDSKTYVTSVTIKDIPVVHQSFFTNEANQGKFIRQLFIYIDTLRENLGKLETNTFFDLKFYNTYGPSQYYNTPRTDMDLELDVYVFEYSDDLASAIRDYVRLLLDGSNSKNSFRVSTLIKDLTTAFDRYIDHVDFKGLNGTFNQYVKETETLTKNLFAPEYLNISIKNLSNVKVIQLETQED